MESKYIKAAWEIEDVEEVKINKSYKLTFTIDIEITPKIFWALLPAVNLNLHSKEIELEWLCIGIYI